MYSVKDEADVALATCFEHVAETFGSRTALVSDGWQPTYAELNAVANRLAHTVISHGGAPGDRIAILMQHDAPAIAAMLAVLKTGRIIVALNPAHPPGGLRELIADSEPSLVITEAALQSLAIEIAGGSYCTVVVFEQHSTKGPDQNPSIEVLPQQLARIGYTSGSTGRPKGVMQTHRQIRRNVIHATEGMQFTANDRIPLFGSLSGGQGMNIACCALLNGMALAPFPIMIKGVTGLADWMIRRNITVFACTSSIFRNFMETLDSDFKFSGIRAVRLGGEPATSDDFKLFQRHFTQDCWFVHTLTSSEASNIAWSRRLYTDTVPEGRLPIGAVSKGQDVLILDEDDRPVAAGEAGEIVVRSRYLAEGYWRSPELTAERFSDDVEHAGTRRVRTGDMGRINADGMLEFCGRRDDRIKIRGNRIEPSEIVGALHRLDGVERAVIDAVPRSGQEALLVGFVTVGRGHSWTQSKLRRALRAALPDYMVPSEFVILQSFPLTPGGKIDREKLRQDFRPRRPSQSDKQPTTQTEALLADVWAEIFGLSDIGPSDDFFALGGDSLIAAVIASKLYANLGVEFDLQTFADNPTLAELASCIDEVRAVPAEKNTPGLVAVPRDKPLPLSSFQLRTWTGSQTPEGLSAYTDAHCWAILGPLDRGAFCDCLSYITKRHEILRTAFSCVDGQPVQIVHPPTPLPVDFFDVAGRPDAQEEAWRILAREAKKPIDLERGPLVRYSLVRVRENEHWWLRVIHHVISDAWSSNLLMQEIGLLYKAKLSGNDPPLPEREPLQYGDFAAWQQKVINAESGAYRAAVQWWKERLSGAPPVFNLPCKRPEPLADVEAAQGFVWWGISPPVSERLNDLGRQHNATFFAVRVAALVAFLAETTQQRDVVLGTYVTNRTQVALQSMMGFFANLATLRFAYNPWQNFHELLSRVSDETRATAVQGNIPYEELRGELERTGSVPPYIQIIVSTGRRSSPNLSGLVTRKLERPPVRMPWGFSINFSENDEENDCHMNFDAGIYDPAAVRTFIDRFRRFLDAVSRHPDRTPSELLRTTDPEPAPPVPPPQPNRATL
jgi:amino acid adenylation domain-containing protein